MNPLRWKFHWQILASLILSALIAAYLKGTNQEDTAFANFLVDGCSFVASIFMQSLKMIVVPLIASSIICGIMGLGKQQAFTRLGTKTLIYYLSTGLIAVIIGLTVVNILQPGHTSAEQAQAFLADADGSESLLQKAEGRDMGDVLDVFLRMIPSNIFDAASNNSALLGVIFFSLLFGYFISKLPNHLKQTQETFWEGCQEIMMLITDLVIRFAPIGVFGLVTPKILEVGFGALQPLILFCATVLLALALHTFVALPLMLKFVGGVSPKAHFKAMTPVILTAFSTASSSSTLPLTMETVEKEAGVSKSTASFTLPLGATVNMDGTALYECIVVIFIAQLNSVLIPGFEFGLWDQIIVVILALTTSIGVAGIPSASLVAITVILGVVGLPPEAIGIVWVTDRILDMCRTSVNVFSDTCGAVIIARTEGESNVYKT